VQSCLVSRFSAGIHIQVIIARQSNPTSNSNNTTSRHSKAQPNTLKQHATWVPSFSPISLPAGTSTRLSCPKRSALSSSASVATGTPIACDRMRSSTVRIPYLLYPLRTFADQISIQVSPIVSRTSPSSTSAISTKYPTSNRCTVSSTSLVGLFPYRCPDVFF
jgi:hypothetical protein